jgi:hypothetical protein
MKHLHQNIAWQNEEFRKSLENVAHFVKYLSTSWSPTKSFVENLFHNPSPCHTMETLVV